MVVRTLPRAPKRPRRPRRLRSGRWTRFPRSAESTAWLAPRRIPANREFSKNAPQDGQRPTGRGCGGAAPNSARLFPASLRQCPAKSALGVTANNAAFRLHRARRLPGEAGPRGTRAPARAPAGRRRHRHNATGPACAIDAGPADVGGRDRRGEAGGYARWLSRGPTPPRRRARWR